MIRSSRRHGSFFLVVPSVALAGVAVLAGCSGSSAVDMPTDTASQELARYKEVPPEKGGPYDGFVLGVCTDRDELILEAKRRCGGDASDFIVLNASRCAGDEAGTGLAYRCRSHDCDPPPTCRRVATSSCVPASVAWAELAAQCSKGTLTITGKAACGWAGPATPAGPPDPSADANQAKRDGGGGSSPPPSDLVSLSGECCDGAPVPEPQPEPWPVPTPDPQPTPEPTPCAGAYQAPVPAGTCVPAADKERLAQQLCAPNARASGASNERSCVLPDGQKGVTADFVICTGTCR